MKIDKKYIVSLLPFLIAGCDPSSIKIQDVEKESPVISSTVNENEVPCVDCSTVVAEEPCVTAPAIADERKGPKQIWADSFIWTKAPELKVEKWLSEKPDTKGKYILLEFWNTWCPPCRRSLAKLNRYHEKYGDELAVIALIDETEESVLAMKEKHEVEPPKCYSAIDTTGFTKKKYGVRGVPHVVIIEPYDGVVIWEGFPGLKGYELTEEKIEKILEVGRSIKKKK